MDYQQTHTKRDVSTTVSLSLRTVTNWTDIGLVVPDISPSKGKGIARLYSDRNVVEFAMIDILNKQFGVSLEDLKFIMNWLRNGSITIVKSSPPHERVLFEDFYSSDNWGKSKELCYVSRFFVDENLNVHKVFLFDLVSNIDRYLKLFSHSPMFKVILLGTVKRLALKRLGWTK